MLVALLYYRPVKAWVDARGELSQRSAVVQRLRVERSRLQARLGSSTSLATLSREARALGYVRPGERLFIVRNINAWRRRNRAAARHR